jgi:hypothetical protein
VPRFDYELRAVFPGMVSLRSSLHPAWALRRLRAFRDPRTIVIAGSETSLMVPRRLRTIVMYHGVAQTHFDRDPTWRSLDARGKCWAQRRMFTRRNRWFVGYARWTSDEFSRHYGVPSAKVIFPWVEPIPREPRDPARRPVVLGDWRTFNKGKDVIPKLERRLPQVEFRPLSCTYETRKAVYAEADLYLCLSLSEGGSFALTDAEAARMPIVTTDVGNCHEYKEAHVIPWSAREDVELVATTIERALATPRGPSFFESWTRERWIAAWHELVRDVATSSGRPALL